MPIVQHDQLQIEHERATGKTPGVTQGIPNNQPPAYIFHNPARMPHKTPPKIQP
jgi:hypothetical protein